MLQNKISIHTEHVLEEDNWKELKAFTDARIALGHTGASLPTKEMLKFTLAHASARDSVHQPFNKQRIAKQLDKMGLQNIQVQSMASNRHIYLTRPDYGRMLSESSRKTLISLSKEPTDITLVIADGLSSKAIHRNAIPLIEQLLPYFNQLDMKLAPVILAEQSRVALGDEIGYRMQSKFVMMLIGERPGLTSPDSLSIYLTYKPQNGRLESERNCISNIRPEGLFYDKAAFKAAWLIEHALAKECTGIELKDNSDNPETYLSVKPKFNLNN